MSSPRAAYEAWHEHLGVDERADAPWHDLVRAHLGSLKGLRVLEIGCGRGGFSAALGGLGAAVVVAADFARSAVGMARDFTRRNQLPVRLAVADIHGIPCRDATFDIVVSCETVEHVMDPPAAVRDIARVLRPGGRLLLTTPNYLGIMGLYRGYRRLTGRPLTEVGQPVNHLVMLPRTLRWVRRAGLHVVAVDGVGHYLPFPGRPPIRLAPLDRARWLTRWTALHSLVVAERPVHG